MNIRSFLKSKQWKPWYIISDNNHIKELFLFFNGRDDLSADFLDAGWFNLTKHNYDEETRDLTMYWGHKDASALEEFEGITKIRVKSIIIVEIKETISFAISGMSLKPKDLKKSFPEQADFTSENLFSTTIGYYSQNDILVEIDYHITPFYSVLITPAPQWRPYDSRRILYHVNIMMCQSRMEDLRERVKDSDDEDHIWGEGNTARRILERVLKLEVSHKYIDALKKIDLSSSERKKILKKPFGNLQLSDLRKTLIGFYNTREQIEEVDPKIDNVPSNVTPKKEKYNKDTFSPTQKKIIDLLERSERLAHTFSHDAGDNLGKNDLYNLCDIVDQCIEAVVESMDFGFQK